ncbi:serine hydrolase [Nonomuraea sp. NPDC059194]|uniref:serine hydrolase n=1 Tax=Nonomuraea sp. NPDC059194 TaxID=3346764 RepID=UPI003686B5AC
MHDLGQLHIRSCPILGLDRVNATLAGLGLTSTRLIGGCATLLGTVLTDLGVTSWEEVARAEPEALRVLSVLDPARTSASTPRETTTLPAGIWRDEAGPAQAREEVRQIMGRQVWPHRLASGFGDEVRVSGKTGTSSASATRRASWSTPTGNATPWRSISGRAPSATACPGRTPSSARRPARRSTSYAAEVGLRPLS